ncbi:GDP dissociation inhibitor-domain-containing protein, partial [Baffinella frigidus]
EARGVVSKGEDGLPAFAKCKFIVGDPSYFPEKCKATSTVLRCIAILSHPITPGNEASAQIILPQASAQIILPKASAQIILPQGQIKRDNDLYIFCGQIKRDNDLYIFCVSSDHCVAAKGKYIAFVSTITTRPKADLGANLPKTANEELKEGLKLLGKTANEDLKEGLKLLGKVDAYFFDTYEIMEPTEGGQKDKCYISKSYDATSHFEQTSEDVMDMYERVYGKPLDLSKTMVNLNPEEE